MSIALTPLIRRPKSVRSAAISPSCAGTSNNGCSNPSAKKLSAASNYRYIAGLQALAYGALLLLDSHVAAQNADTPPGTSPLGIRQQRVERMVDDLDRKFKSLILALQSTEPDRAKRLHDALNRTKELLIQKRMTDVVRLLDQAQLDAAGETQQALLSDIRTLLALLLSENSERQESSAEFDRLQEFKRDLESLLFKQRIAHQESSRLAAEKTAAEKTSPNDSRLAELARDQDQLAMQAGTLGQQMHDQPGQKSISAAQASMAGASGQLRKQNPADASRQQQDAIASLLSAIREVEERANEFRGAALAEKRSRLAEHFQAMLQTQQRLTSQTVALEQKRMAQGQLTRVDRNVVRSIGEEHRRATAIDATPVGLAGLAQQAIDILAADGTTIVFVDVVQQLRDDLVAVGGWLADDLRTDAFVSLVQRDIESTLQELVESLQQIEPQNQSSPESSNSSAGEGNQKGRQKLLPASAELKMLRSAQLQVNRRTAAIDQQRTAAGVLDSSLKEQTQKLADRQSEIEDLTSQLLNRNP